MATRWLYETASGVNFCLGMTSDDDNTDIPPWNDDNTPRLPMAWSAPDPLLEPPAEQDLVPPKRYDIVENKIYLCTPGQNQARNLREAKFLKYAAITEKTTRLFRKGLQYDSKRFPLDLDDYANYMTLYDNRNNTAVVTWPHTIITRIRNLDGYMEAYTIASAPAMKLFGEAAMARMREIVDGARDLGIQVGLAATVAEVIAITDTRT